MGTGAEIWVPALISAIGAGASAYNTHEVAKDQDKAAAIGIANQAAKQQQADSRVSQAVDALNTGTPEDSRKVATDNFLTALKQNQDKARVQGMGGGRFSTELGAANESLAEGGKDQANVLGRIAGATTQRENEQTQFGRAGTDLNVLAREASGQGFIDQLRARSVKRNPWIDAGASGLQGYASGMAGSTGNDGTLTSTLDNGYTFNTKMPKAPRY